MDANERITTLFTTRLRQLILQYREALQEGRALREALDKAEEDKRRLDDTLAETRRELESLKTAKMLEITSGDIEAARSRMAKLVRDVNRCITYLNEK